MELGTKVEAGRKMKRNGSADHLPIQGPADAGRGAVRSKAASASQGENRVIINIEKHTLKESLGL